MEVRFFAWALGAFAFGAFLIAVACCLEYRIMAQCHKFASCPDDEQNKQKRRKYAGSADKIAKIRSRIVGFSLFAFSAGLGISVLRLMQFCC